MLKENKPVPWTLEQIDDDRWVVREGAKIIIILNTVGENGKAIAERVVKCANMHSELVSGLKGAMLWLKLVEFKEPGEFQKIWNIFQDVIDKAEGEQSEIIKGE